MSRSLQDQFIDDDEEETCPLCIEPLDLSDRNFRPCPCGYQVCQFCYNNIKTTMNGLCPACRRVYDEKNIEWKSISPEEMANYKAEVAQKAKKSAQIRQKEAQKREADSLSRKHLAGLRVVQKNLVYVTGLAPTVQQDKLLETLRGDQYFGQYGKIVKIVVSKAKDTSHPQQSVGVYVTFARKEDAATCIAAVDDSPNGDRVLRAQYGTTKYCSAYLRGETCGNRNCMFLHEPGDDSESFTRQDLSSMNVISTQHPSTAQRSQAPPQHPPQPIASATAQMDRQDSNEDNNDRPALPSTASWANKPPHVAQVRRSSQATASSGASPATRPAKVEPPIQSAPPAHSEPQQHPVGKGKTKSTPTSVTSTPQQPPKEPQKEPTTVPEPEATPATPTPKSKSTTSDFDSVLAAVATSSFSYNFSAIILSEEDQKVVSQMPLLFDPNGGAKRRAMKERQQQQQEEVQAALLQQQPTTAVPAAAAVATDSEEATEGGSLQLGGEPEERDVGLGRGQHAAIGPPNQLGSGLGLGQNFGLNEGFATLGFDGRGLNTQQQQALLQRIKTDPQAATLLNAFQGGQQSQQSSLSQAHMNTAPAHARQTSRFSFANDSGTATTNVKPVANQSLMKQQSAMLPSQTPPFNQLGQAQGLGSQFYGTNVHGPPPGLKTTGTPPVSGGGMFGQGHGFTSGSLGYGGVSAAGRNANDEMMRDLLRSRGSNVGGNQMSEAAKRELPFPYHQAHPSTSTPAPAPGLISLPFGPQSYQDSASQKQKKKGKKHRHANTSSSGGGGLVDADPSILQARLHQGNAAMVGQGIYSGQGQGDSESITSRTASLDLSLSPSTVAPIPYGLHMPPGILETPRRQTPTIPPGLSASGRNTPTIPPGFANHPMAELIEARQRSYTGTPTRSNTPITPALPLLPPGLGRNMTPKRDHPESNLGLEATSTGQDDDMKVFDKTVAVPDISPEPGTTSSKPLKGAYGSAGKSEKAEQADLAHRGSPMKSKKNKDSTVRQEKTALKKTPDTVPTHTSAPETTSPPKRSVLPPATVSNENEPKAKRQTPGKLDINAATTASAQEKIDEEGGTRTRASSKASVSIPTTSTAALKGSPVKKSAPSKILRVVQTPKTETPPPLSASPASSVPIPHVPGVVGARSSRQASVASINLPSTPVNELASETASVTSASLSRASSPPPGSKVVPAPRMKSKSQAKKERHERAKQLAEEKAAAEEVTKPSDEPVQEPILGRKKKAKKAKAVVSTAASLPASTKTKKAEKSEPAETKEPTQSTPAPDASQPAIEHPREATPTTAPVQPERVERPVTPEEAKRRVPTAASIIADLQVNGDLLQHALEFFKPMSTLAQRGEITRADLENLERKIPYSKKDHENIAKHIPVQLGGVDESRPSERALVMPEGVLWNLTKDLERRYLELEERVKEAKGASKYRHKRQTNKRGGAGNPMAASSNFLPSFANVVNNAHAKSNGSTKGHGGADFQGGASGTLSPMDDPVKFLNQFVLPTDSSVGSSMRGGEAIGTAKMASAIPANLLQDLGEAGRLAAELLEGYIVQSFNGSGVSMGGRGANVEDIEREMFESRKQVEKLEKQLNTLVKKNRKVLGGSH